MILVVKQIGLSKSPPHPQVISISPDVIVVTLFLYLGPKEWPWALPPPRGLQNAQLVPLNNRNPQLFGIRLNVAGQMVSLNFRVRYNDMADYWELTIYDEQFNLLLDSEPMLTGDWPAANLLGQYQYLGIGSAYIINISNTKYLDWPDNTDLGSDFILLWADPTDPIEAQEIAQSGGSPVLG